MLIMPIGTYRIPFLGGWFQRHPANTKIHKLHKSGPVEQSNNCMVTQGNKQCDANTPQSVTRAREVLTFYVGHQNVQH